jgi:iron(III) transport system substrate-binding protein
MIGVIQDRQSMISFTKTNIMAIILSGTIAIASGCTANKQINSAEGTKQTTRKEINLYSSRHYDSDDRLYQQFTQETGIKINLIEGKDDELIERIKSEGKNTPADVFITVDVGRLWRAQQQGIMQPISSKTLENKIPQNLRSPEGYWFALTKRARVIVYNTQKVKPSDLSTYEALAEPKWKGRICVRSSANIYNQSLVAATIEKIGEAKTQTWIEGLVKNFAIPPQGNDVDRIKSVASGQCDVSIVNHYYFARLKQSTEPKNKEITSKVALFFPNQKEDGTHINISGAGVVVNAPHKENAIKFIEYLVTPEAQAIFANANEEYPVISGVKTNQTLASFGNFKESKLDVVAYGKRNAEAVKLMDKAGWN